MAAFLSVTQGYEAKAQVTNSEVIFVVDESGSMGGEHAFLPGFVTDLDARLTAAGVTSRQFGLTGFGGGGVGNLGRTFNVGGMLLGSAATSGRAEGVSPLATGEPASGSPARPAGVSISGSPVGDPLGTHGLSSASRCAPAVVSGSSRPAHPDASSAAASSATVPRRSDLGIPTYRPGPMVT